MAGCVVRVRDTLDHAAWPVVGDVRQSGRCVVRVTRAGAIGVRETGAAAECIVADGHDQ